MLFRSDRKSTRLNSSHTIISYAVFCLKKKIQAAHTPLAFAAADTPPHAPTLDAACAPSRGTPHPVPPPADRRVCPIGLLFFKGGRAPGNPPLPPPRGFLG